jgi:hypothetical protein
MSNVQVIIWSNFHQVVTVADPRGAGRPMPLVWYTYSEIQGQHSVPSHRYLGTATPMATQSSNFWTATEWSVQSFLTAKLCTLLLQNQNNYLMPKVSIMEICWSFMIANGSTRLTNFDEFVSRLQLNKNSVCIYFSHSSNLHGDELLSWTFLTVVWQFFCHGFVMCFRLLFSCCLIRLLVVQFPLALSICWVYCNGCSKISWFYCSVTVLTCFCGSSNG